MRAPLPLQVRFIHRNVVRFGYGCAPPLVLEVALKNRVFHLLDDGAKTAEEVSAACGASLRGITFILNALVGLGMIRKRGGRYANVRRMTDFLLARRRTEEDAWIRKTGLETAYYGLSSKLTRKWLDLGDAVRTGAPVLACDQEEVGAAYFIEFAEAMFANSFRAAYYFAYKVNGVSKRPMRVLDLGAGSAAWSLPWALKSPETRVTAVDWEGVLPLAKRIAATLGVASQYDFVASDLLEAKLGRGYQLALIGHTIHTEGEARSRQLIRNCYDALEPGGSIVIAEWVADDDRCGPMHVMVYAVTMLLVSHRGDTYTFSEMAKWLAEAGFTEIRKVPVPAPSPLIVAKKPSRCRAT